MKNLYIKGSDYIPEVNFNADKGELWISGEGYLEYPTSFTKPLFEWLNTYTSEGSRKITFNFKLTYFTTTFSRHIGKMIDLLEEYQLNKAGEVIISWHYKKNDLDILEHGKEFAEDSKLTFNLISY